MTLVQYRRRTKNGSTQTNQSTTIIQELHLRTNSLSPTRFELLQTDTEQQLPLRIRKAQPVIVPNIGDIRHLCQILNEGSNSVKIQPTDIAACRQISVIDELERFPANAFQLKQDEVFRVIIGYLLPSTKPQAIQEELNRMGHTLLYLPETV